MRDRALRGCLIAVVLAACVGVPKTTASPGKPDQASNAGRDDASNQIYQLPSFPLWWDSDQEKTNDLSEHAKEKGNADWWLVRLTGVLGVIGLLQLAVFGLQARRLRQSIDTMRELGTQQSTDMTRSISQATRAATAMEDVATGIGETVSINKSVIEGQRDFWSRQMRAYISIDTGGYLRQNRRFRFEFQPNIANNGQTPANSLTVISRIEIKVPNIPDDFDFSLTPDHVGQRSVATMFPRQTRFHSATYHRRCTMPELRGLGKENSFSTFGDGQYTTISSIRQDLPISVTLSCSQETSAACAFGTLLSAITTPTSAYRAAANTALSPSSRFPSRDPGTRPT